MKWSIPIARVAGIPVRMHLSFLLVVAWAAAFGWQEGGWHSSMWAGVLVSVLFVCVVMHELGHSLVAMAFGSEVASITLYPIGGVAGLRRIPRRPAQELVMAGAGPAVNMIIALTLAGLRGGFPDGAVAAVFPRNVNELWDALIRTNVVLAVFNLVPAFPMDGGRILRAILAMLMPYARATRTAAAIGQALAVGIILLGLFAANPFLVLIGIFVFWGGGAEERLAVVESALRHLCARDVMTRRFFWVHPTDSLAYCAQRADEMVGSHLLVEDNGRIVGLLSSADLHKAMSTLGTDVPVAQIMRKVFLCVDAAAPMNHLYRDMPAMEQPVLPVIDQGRVVGVLTPELVAGSLRLAYSHSAEEIEEKLSRAQNTQRFVIDLG